MRIIDRDIVEHAGQVDVLLGKGLDQVVILRPGDGKHRHLVELGIVEARQQMRAAGSGRCETYAELSGELGIGTRHEGGRFLMPDLDEPDPILALAQRLHDAVDAISGKAEDDLDIPFDQRVNQYVGGIEHRTRPLLVKDRKPASLSKVPSSILGADTAASRYRRLGLRSNPMRQAVDEDGDVKQEGDGGHSRDQDDGDPPAFQAVSLLFGSGAGCLNRIFFWLVHQDLASVETGAGSSPRRLPQMR